MHTEHSISLIDKKIEIERIDKFLMEYSIEHLNVNIFHISLTKAYEYLNNDVHRGKIIASLLDIQATYLHLHIDNNLSMRAWQSGFRSLDSATPLRAETYEWFKYQIHSLRSLNAFVLRYRSIWDKILSLLILIHAPQAYEGFQGAKSRKRAFKKIYDKNPFLPTLDMDNLLSHIERFDNSYRTAEAHGTGVLRKKLLVDPPGEADPHLPMTIQMNFLVRFIADLSEAIFEGRANIP
ncbi:hypothetical protein [Burkholderia ubonensis]|uniref:hypothetical protein n=1 Tax=Burkholderia ubonensis TaxID=101571 RepID=UPI000AA3CEC6|nr:hypothetical protein [Burkholderia ubonensis]